VPVEPKVLVVGTTADYIDWIQKSCPGQALFLTEPGVRRQAEEPCPLPGEEILSNLDDFSRCRQELQRYLDRYDIRLNGVACFDCESMELAAVLARHYELPYPSVTAVNNCRNKYLTKDLWQSQQLPTPKARRIRSQAEAAAFFNELGKACVLKPLTGSGSEFVFYCDSAQACEHSFYKIQQGLDRCRANRLYRRRAGDEPQIVAEEFIEGDEYSCDFILENGQAEIIRLTRKMVSSDRAFGTALGYLLPGVLPRQISEDQLRQTAYRSATALGLDRAVCMLDFMIDQGRVVLLELAPRPGGDCLPFLLRRSRGLDVLKLFLDFCQQRPLELTPIHDSRALLAMRLHAGKSGILKKIDKQHLQQDPRVKEIYLTRKPGHPIKMPPEDYDSWLLGHVIFEPDQSVEVQLQCQALLDRLIVEIE
jgi:biotin carboxylase